MKLNGVERVTGDLADGVIEEREKILRQLIEELPDVVQRARDGAEPKSLDSLVLAMASYISLWINNNFDEDEAIKAYMVDAVTNGIALLCGYAVESEVIVEAPTEH